MANDEIKFARLLDSLSDERKIDEMQAVSLNTESAERLKELKRLMDWDNDITLNAALTLHLKTEKDSVIEKSTSKKSRTIRFNPSVKNMSIFSRENAGGRAEADIDAMIESGIKILYAKLLNKP